MKNPKNQSLPGSEVLTVTPTLLMLVPNEIGPSGDIESLMSLTEGVYSNWIGTDAVVTNAVEVIAILQTDDPASIVVSKEALETYPEGSTDAEAITQHFAITYSANTTGQNYLWYFKFDGPDNQSLLNDPNTTVDTVPLVDVTVTHDLSLVPTKNKRQVKSVPVKAFKGGGSGQS